MTTVVLVHGAFHDGWCWELVRGANRYVDAAAPWALVKDPARKVELDHVLHTFLEAVLWSALLVWPAMPGKSAEIIAQLLAVIRSAPVTFDHIVLHPVPNPVMPDDPERGYMARVAREILPAVRSALGAPSTSEKRNSNSEKRNVKR